MKYFKPRSYAVIFTLVAGLMVAACSSSDNTVVINDAPISSSNTDTTQAPTQNESGQPFQQLTIGENQPIRSLDPLFAQNASELRAIQQIYEGLVRYNQNRDIIPAVARKWSQRNDHKTYRFTLQHNLFYQDSEVFSNGRGRRVVADDIKADFKRMAQAKVPDDAAHFFMNIKGFEPYFREQHQVMRSSDRQLKGVSGITVPNDSTVVFSLVDPDEHFLQRLAMPYAVIYPPESASQNGFQAVGTGPFKLSQMRSDSLYILAKFQNYYKTNQPKIDRLDIVTSRSEEVLLNQMSTGDIQLLPDMGPRQMQMVLGSDVQLSPTLSSNYQLIDGGGIHHYFLRYYEGADAQKDAVQHVVSSVQVKNYFPALPSDAYNLRWSAASSPSTSRVDSLSGTYSGNPFVRHLYEQLSHHFAQKGTHFSMSQTRVPNRTTPLYIDSSIPFMDAGLTTTPENTLLTLSTKNLGLEQKNVANKSFNAFYWWMNLRETSVPSTNQ